jgi:hypothetical protein
METAEEMEKRAYVKILLDKSGNLIGAVKDGEAHEAVELPEGKVPSTVKEHWNLRLMKVWHHNPPCCVQLGGYTVCWPPCV